MKINHVYFLVVLACFFWGVGFPIAKVGVEVIHPFSFAFIRFSLVFVLFVFLFKLSPFNLFLKLKDNFTILFLMALTGIFLYGVFFLFAVKFAKASDVSLVSGFNPAITALIAAIFLKEKVNLVMIAGIILSFIGVSFIVLKGNFAALDFNIGSLLMLVATTMWAIYSVLTKKALVRMNLFEAVSLVSLIGAVLFLPVAIIFGDLKNFIHYPLKGWLSILYMAVFSTVFAFSAWYKSIEVIGASRSSVFVNLVPVFGVLTSVLFFNESFGLYEFIGGILVIGGVILTNKR